MDLEISVPFWVLTLSYWIHLLATVTWLGGLLLLTVVAWPAVRDHFMSPAQWLGLQGRFSPLVNASLVLLWITGFVQMTADPNYAGFLTFDSLWAKAILVKHIAVIAMLIIAIYIQWRLHPALKRLAVMEKKHPERAAADRETLALQEARLLRLNLVCAAAVLFLTAIATAV